MTKISVRQATCQDTNYLSEVPPYSRCKHDYPVHGEDIFIAEREGKILGAISVSNKNILVVYGDWKDDFEPCLSSLQKEFSGPWISKLYVFPEYRRHRIGTKLVEKACKSLEQKCATEVYAGIYIKNESREISTRILEDHGFKKIGSCICPLENGYCRGSLFRKNLVSSKLSIGS